jgi:hypothetical protein
VVPDLQFSGIYTLVLNSHWLPWRKKRRKTRPKFISILKVIFKKKDEGAESRCLSS